MEIKQTVSRMKNLRLKWMMYLAALVLCSVGLRSTGLAEGLSNQNRLDSSSGGQNTKGCPPPQSSNVIQTTISASKSEQVNKFGICALITADSSVRRDYLVPFKSELEWKAFLNHLPSGITAAQCSVPEWSPWSSGICNPKRAGDCGKGAGTLTQTSECSVLECPIPSDSGLRLKSNDFGKVRCPSNSRQESIDCDIACTAGCGSANGQNFSSAPTTNLCTDSTTPPVSKNGSGCGWAYVQGDSTLSAPTSVCNVTNVGAFEGASSFSSGGVETRSHAMFECKCSVATWNWTCGSTSCSAKVSSSSAPLLTNGSCGTSAGGSFASAPSVNLCATGTNTAVLTASNKYTWTCAGSNGGSDKLCNANVSTADPKPPCFARDWYNEGSAGQQRGGTKYFTDLISCFNSDNSEPDCKVCSVGCYPVLSADPKVSNCSGARTVAASPPVGSGYMDNLCGPAMFSGKVYSSAAEVTAAGPCYSGAAVDGSIKEWSGYWTYTCKSKTAFFGGGAWRYSFALCAALK